MTLQRMEHTGNAIATALQSSITAVTTSIIVAQGNGFPTGAVGPFVLTIDADQPNEEKVLCGLRSSNTFTVAPLGRGWDNTGAGPHSANAVVRHVWSAFEADDTNDHIYTLSRDDHHQYSLVTGGRPFTGGVTISSGGLTATGPTQLNGNLNVTGSTTLAGVTANSPVSLPGGASAAANITAPTFTSSGVPGATQAMIIGGATLGGAPVSGSWVNEQIVFDLGGGGWQYLGAAGWVRLPVSNPQWNFNGVGGSVSGSALVGLTSPQVVTAFCPSTLVRVTQTCSGMIDTAGGSGSIGFAISGATTLSWTQTAITGYVDNVPAHPYGVPMAGVAIVTVTRGNNTFTTQITGAVGNNFRCAANYLLVEPL